MVIAQVVYVLGLFVLESFMNHTPGWGYKVTT
jgi:hypothetical protein